MWHELWPDTEPDDVPIGHVTNAVHAPTWISEELQDLLRDAGVRLGAGPGEQAWDRATALDPTALWQAHARHKVSMLEEAVGPSRGHVGGGGVDPDALTIVFARRFAAYKRAALVFTDLERLLALLTDSERPVQLVFTGKAYPTDDEGKAILARVAEIARSPDAQGRVVLLEDYDLELARLLVQGADVWLNNPRRPEEASATSGMKAGMNGVLNLSVLDGWWPEAFSPRIGWAIPEDVSAQGDEREATELLRLLEEEVVPTYYERDADGLPARWIEMMQASIAAIGRDFNGARMLAEYTDRFYLPAHEAGVAGSARAR
jgi:starch phosphorylase